FQFLKHCYQQACRDHQTKLASFAIAVDTIDPLMALNHLTAPNQRQWQNWQVWSDGLGRLVGSSALETEISWCCFERVLIDGGLLAWNWNNETCFNPWPHPDS
ncbi:MAG: hypothetical protein AAFY67_11530, partial [Cyanobacteria bacterium J06642_9]